MTNADVPGLHHIVLVNHKNIHLVLYLVSRLLRNDQHIVKGDRHLDLACFTVLKEAVGIRKLCAERDISRLAVELTFNRFDNSGVG